MKRIVEFEEKENGRGEKYYVAGSLICHKEWIDAFTKPVEEPHKSRIGDVFSTGFNRYVVTAFDGEDVYIMYDDGICGHTTEERIWMDDCYIGHVNMPALYEYMKIMDSDAEKEEEKAMIESKVALTHEQIRAMLDRKGER